MIRLDWRQITVNRCKQRGSLREKGLFSKETNKNESFYKFDRVAQINFVENQEQVALKNEQIFDP